LLLVIMESGGHWVARILLVGLCGFTSPTGPALQDVRCPTDDMLVRPSWGGLGFGAVTYGSLSIIIETVA
jgi:hypothetical protein